jgi:hypothetical protein
VRLQELREHEVCDELAVIGNYPNGYDSRKETLQVYWTVYAGPKRPRYSVE